MAIRPRVIVASPDPIESEAIADWLGAEGFESVRRPSLRAAVEEIQAHSFDLLIADEVFAFKHGLHVAARARRPTTPSVVIGDTLTQTESVNRQVLYLARPVERALVICTVSLAMMDARPVRCSQRKPVRRFEALVNGVPSYIIDISNEGLRLEVPRDKQTVPPPYFNVRVPLIGVAVTVQRMWARTAAAEGKVVTWCGGSLSQGQIRAAGAWRSFVDTIPTAGGPADSFQIQ